MSRLHPNMKLGTKLLLLTLMQLASLTILSLFSLAAFDLNLMPSEQKVDVFSLSRKQVLAPDTSSSSAGARVKSPKKIPAAFYAKVMRLFDMLEVCNQENFGIDSVSDSFSIENKALMALNAIAKSNLIKKSDQPRYNRIMKNCAKISQAIQAKLESTTDLFSQMSGETYENRMARFRESPLVSLRDRFAESPPRSSQRLEENHQPETEKLKTDHDQKTNIQQETVTRLETLRKQPIQTYNFLS